MHAQWAEQMHVVGDTAACASAGCHRQQRPYRLIAARASVAQVALYQREEGDLRVPRAPAHYSTQYVNA